MQIIVDGKKAVLKKDLSFEYVRENPLFSETEDYSMEIIFPLEDCPENIAIFGALHVKSVDISTVSFPAEIIAAEFYKHGILTIVSIIGSEVKCQFLEGMSAQNFHQDLNSVYLNELDFSQWDGTAGGWENFPDGDYATGRNAGWVEFPVYDKKKEFVIEAVNQGDGYYCYSRHIYLWKLVALVANATGWNVNQSALTRLEMYKRIVVVNTRNFMWRDFAERIRPLSLSLPHWTVTEFYDQIGKFFGCLVDINKDSHQVTFKAYTDVVRNAPKVNLSVNDEYTVEVDTKETPKYRGTRKFTLPAEANPNNINSCPFIMSDPRIPHEQMTKSEFLAQIESLAAHSNEARYDGAGWLYYLTDTGEWAAIAKKDDSVTKGYVYIPGDPEPSIGGYYVDDVDMEHPTIIYEEAEILNQFGTLDSEGEELKICPCPLEGPFADFHYGWNYNLQPRLEIFMRRRMPSLDIPEDPDDGYESDVPEMVPDIMDRLTVGERKTDDMYFNKLWVVLWQDQSDVAGGVNAWYTRKQEPYCSRKRAEYWLNGGWHAIKDDDGNPIYGEYTKGFTSHLWNLDPNDQSLQANKALPAVDETKLYRYKFLSSTLPDPKSIYIIRGKQYVCAKLTAHFTDTGMSELIEGEFYEIVG